MMSSLSRFALLAVATLVVAPLPAHAQQKVNLRRAEITADTVIVNVTAIFGGLEFEVPEHWQVINEVVGIFGATDDQTVQPSPDTAGVKRLVLRGAAIFGGVCIKNNHSKN